MDAYLDKGVEEFKKQLNERANLLDINKRYKDDGRTLLQKACHMGEFEIVKCILIESQKLTFRNNAKLDINARSVKSCETALIIAARRRQWRIVRNLLINNKLGHQICIHARSRYDTTALMEASMNHVEWLMQRLLIGVKHKTTELYDSEHINVIIKLLQPHLGHHKGAQPCLHLLTKYNKNPRQIRSSIRRFYEYHINDAARLYGMILLLRFEFLKIKVF